MKNSLRQIIRFINPKPNDKIIEIQSEPTSEKEFNGLLNICEYTNMRLLQVRNKLAEMGIYYDHVTLTPKIFVPAISSHGGLFESQITHNDIDLSHPIDVRLEYKQEKFDAKVIRSVAFSPCGNFMAYSRDDKIEVVTLTAKDQSLFRNHLPFIQEIIKKRLYCRN